MKNIIRLAAVVFSVVLMLSAVVLPASAQVPYDSLSQYGQLTLEANASTKVEIDGVVTPGEYTSEGIKLTHESVGMQLLNWTATNPISQEDLLEVLPESVTYYISYDKEGLYLAAEVVEANFYNTCGTRNDMWTVDCLEFDVAVDAYGSIAEGTFTREDACDRIRMTMGLMDYGTGELVPEAVIYTQPSYCDTSTYPVYGSVDGHAITRNDETQTTTYECYMKWENLYMETIVPEQIFINFQLHLADGRYLGNVEPGYGGCVGALRFSGVLTEEQQAELGATGGMCPHIVNLVDAKELNSETVGEETTAADEEATEAPTEADTSATTEATTSATTEADTDASTEAGTSATTEAGTDAAKDGCGASVAMGAVLFMTAAAAVVLGKKKN